MDLTEDDWNLIAGLWEERDRLLAEKHHLLTQRACLRIQMRTVNESLASVKRDLRGLTDVQIASKFEVSVMDMYRHKPLYSRVNNK